HEDGDAQVHADLVDRVHLGVVDRDLRERPGGKDRGAADPVLLVLTSYGPDAAGHVVGVGYRAGRDEPVGVGLQRGTGDLGGHADQPAFESALVQFPQRYRYRGNLPGVLGVPAGTCTRPGTPAPPATSGPWSAGG